MSNETFKIDSGYSQNGVYWEVHRYNLRYANLYETRVNGKAVHHRSKDACYKHLQDTKVARFKKTPTGKDSYHYEQEYHGSDDNISPSDDRRSDTNQQSDS